ncbi:hypothetical protein KKH23_05650, partial [Patescibacteria group bacterium]|nr:hypothetical protein [Patescibacteria group bacterium]
MIYVGPEGSPAAEIVMIGEAPADEETRKGRPFVGSAGQFFDDLIQLAGLFRGELYITNIRKYKVPGNKMSRLPYEELVNCRAELIEEINSLDGPKVIVPLGKYALETVTDKKGITNFRGSPLRPKSSIKHDCIVVPTFHPSVMHYGEKYNEWPLIVADLSKAKRIRDEGFEFPTFQFITQPTLTEVFDTLDMLLERKLFVTIDVETPHNLLSCIGLGWSRTEALCIPFFWGSGSNYWSYTEELALWQKLREVLPQLNWGNQNVMFDAEILYNHKIKLAPAFWDPMLMHSCLYSEMRHNLETITSIYTDLVFYKRSEEEDKVKGSVLRAGRERDHWNYNCMDVISAYWAIEELKEELIEEGMLPVYETLFGELLGIVFDMNITGTPVDVERLPKVREDMENELVPKQKALEDTVGHELNANSYPQVRKVFFDEMKWTPYRTKDGKIDTGAKAMEKYAYKYQSEIPTLIKEIREEKSFMSIFKDENIEDGRFKCSYSLTSSKFGRLASRKTFSGKGRNLHNVKKGSARSFFIAEPGDFMLGGDQRQAEARIVAYYSKDEGYIAAAESGRIHLDVGARVYNDPNFSTDDPRYRAAKSLVHGTDYGMSPWGFARAANISLAKAKEDHAEFHNAFPGIRNTYYQYIQDCIRHNRTLYNPFGRRNIFFGHINETMFRAGYSFIPQSTIGDI